MGPKDAAGGGGGGEEFGDAGFGEHVPELRLVRDGFVAEHADEPSMNGGERDWTGAARARTVRPRRNAGGDAGHEALEAGGGAVEARAERDQEWEEARVPQEAVSNEFAHGGEDEGDSLGLGGGASSAGVGGWERRCGHEIIPISRAAWAQGKSDGSDDGVGGA